MSIKNDALQYAKAKLASGEGAGLLRRKVQAQLSEKLKDEIYAEKFNLELENIDMSKVQKSVDFDNNIKNVKDISLSGFKFAKKTLAALGISGAAAVAYYITHKEQCDAMIKSGSKNIGRSIGKIKDSCVEKAKDVKNYFKNKFCKKKQEAEVINFMDKIHQSSYNQG